MKEIIVKTQEELDKIITEKENELIALKQSLKGIKTEEKTKEKEDLEELKKELGI
jgi:hypothetical protein